MSKYTNIRKIWHFLWYEDSWLSWIVNIIIAFLLVKFVIYPGIGFLLGTEFPVVAVVSSSMEHHKNFDDWWSENQNYYKSYFTKDDFKKLDFYNGFNRGDIMVLIGIKEIKKGDIVVYKTNIYRYPIIHRVVSIDPIATKGDNNKDIDKESIDKERIVGKAILRIPLLGWIKIWFTELISLIRF